MKQIELKVTGIKCGNCSKKIEDGLGNLENINSISVSVSEGTVKVEGQDNLSAMSVKKSIEELGFGVDAMKKV